MKLNSKGFTLLEVALAVSILAVLTVFISQTTQKAVEAKKKIQAEMDRMIELRETMNVISRDVGLAFNYRDINIALYNAAKLELAKTGATPTPPPGGPPSIGNGIGNAPQDLKQEVIVTQFMGEEEKLNFSTLSYIRTQENEKSGDQAEVGYFLKNCRSRTDKKVNTNCLWRRISPLIDEKIDEGGEESVILEDVTKLSFRYLGPGHTEEWARSWATDGSLEEIMKGNFPYAVEISLVIEDKRSNPPRKLAMTTVAPLNFSNNPEGKDATAPSIPGP